MGDSKPISRCNFIYKCITKNLTNRLNACLNDIISPNQTAFVLGRNIAELSHKIVKTTIEKKAKAGVPSWWTPGKHMIQWKWWSISELLLWVFPQDMLIG